MKRRIEQEINQTLSCLNGLDDIEVSPDFIDNVTGRIGQLQATGPLTTQNRLFYPAAIVLLVIMTISLFIVSFSSGTITSGSNYQAEIIAAEYGIGQSITAY